MSTTTPPPDSMSGSTRTEPSHRAMEQAAEWYALLRSGEATDDDHARWQSWLEHNADHRLAWQYVETISRSFEPIRATPDPRQTADDLWAVNKRVIQRRKILTGIVVLTGTGLSSWAAWRHTPLPGIVLAQMADYRTATGELREVVMPDGTHVWLNTATALNEAYHASLRRLCLITGEILIDTATDPQRPFVVDTPQGRLRALGTRFTVRLESDKTFLGVYQGSVEITFAAGTSSLIQAGQQTHFATDALAAIEPADIAREAWSRGVLVAWDMSLGEVVKELRRYRNGYLGIAPEVAHLRVFGSFPLRNTDNTLSMLASALPIRIQRTLPWWVSIEARANADQSH
ncbi:MAG TPA: FecR domain-containing protein [Nitrosomonas europaea]|uniref:FecR domain-containing protein n=1 Tax=Nitrosomonas europaea TaxID=915 RepID=UPI00249251A9|nr:FecR domain-containing protein [Nitrosomonas europaea]HRN82389.1 FecR domain-containing protein [Nitrosomonas europaea]HRO55905.1 FecR domain-containing protein [Nitrosomonas europaea]HUM73579.1 FecR domain-containing protein [Nitrosomonas europaea]